MTKQLPIGVFDSGMGGLTVLKALRRLLPNEAFIYLGDTARLPYGTKSGSTVVQYASRMTRVLVEQEIKLMVIACNTATTAALPQLQQQLPDLPIVGVVQPGAQAAVAATKNNTIAILATETTVASNGYPQTIHELKADINIIQQACGLFVALAEEGHVDDELAAATIKQYLKPITHHQPQPDTVLLGCTHFPALIKPIRDFLGEEVTIVDSSQATAEMVKQILQQRNLHSDEGDPARTRFLVTDLPERFIRVSGVFLEKPIDASNITLID